MLTENECCNSMDSNDDGIIAMQKQQQSYQGYNKSSRSHQRFNGNDTRAYRRMNGNTARNARQSYTCRRAC